ncbi:hypothetical protein F751_4222 [Auxenochlorella protothecoides]|uniref:Uncharacterized protein n=1 Tax=Auxenochlorella protothecoides TaxID=3075 RepID=A0A087SA24_AUXPR|nr:hypothetical protein F751_4222 [Auxenochlorella protothecoides]KFM22578.1 hypothetical protein F751_4222 [Auxenochlorella protothecoides]
MEVDAAPRPTLHHLTRHWLPEEERGASVLDRFGASSLEAARHAVRTMGQRELRAAFQRVYGSPTQSFNNNWLRRKLLEALGLRALTAGRTTPSGGRLAAARNGAEAARDPAVPLLQLRAWQGAAQAPLGSVRLPQGHGWEAEPFAQAFPHAAGPQQHPFQPPGPMLERQQQQQQQQRDRAAFQPPHGHEQEARGGGAGAPPAYAPRPLRRVYSHPL